MRIWMMVAIALLVAAVGMADTGEPRFAVYRVRVPDAELEAKNYDQGQYRRERLERMTQEYVLERAVLIEPPVLTERDIVAYCWQEQRIVLTEVGALRWNELGGTRIPLGGLPVVVVAAGEACYAGVIWSPVSSAIPRLPQFWSFAVNDRLVTDGPGGYGDPDARFDPRVKKVMSDLKKLTPTCPSP